MNSKNETGMNLEEFMEIFPIVLEDIITGVKIDMQELKIHVEELLRYVVPNGKKIRGLMVPEVYKTLEKREHVTSEKIKISYVMGWIIEIGQAAGLMIDDIIDRSQKRRGLPCWHTKKYIGLNAIKDARFLEQVLSLYKLVHAAYWKTVCGEAIDCMSTKDGKPNMTLFTIENYKIIAKHKTAYIIYVPVAMGLYLVNISNETLHKEAQNLLLEIGEIFQIQNDFHDCFGDDEHAENRGDDIREGKCTWLAVKALEKANSQQRKIFECYYGSHHPKAIEIICKLYQDLDLTKMYADYEDESFDKIQSRIQELPGELPVQVFSKIMRGLYKRKF